jgi:hypothetical protein
LSLSRGIALRTQATTKLSSRLSNGRPALLAGTSAISLTHRVKLPRFRGVFGGNVDYGSVLTTSIMAS